MNSLLELDDLSIMLRPILDRFQEPLLSDIFHMRRLDRALASTPGTPVFASHSRLLIRSSSIEEAQEISMRREKAQSILGKDFEYFSVHAMTQPSKQPHQEVASSGNDFRPLIFPPRRLLTETEESEPQDLFYYLQELQLVRAVSRLALIPDWLGSPRHGTSSCIGLRSA